ncbi:GAF domain-containing protein [Marisediminicola sp. LYQ134]|uniref:GAF domain-containing protein n=1 Tax=Marisediminicola sp. LYQ134 TaxID=3391061 RepID=UPI0039830400
MTAVSMVARPFVRAWMSVASSTWHDIARPPARGLGHAPGENPLHVLMIGSGAATGWGVLSHDLALPGHTARALAAALDRGAQVDVIVDSNVTVATASKLISPINIEVYDAVIIALGMNDVFRMTSPRAWARHYSRLLADVQERCAHTTLFVTSVPPVPLMRSMTRVVHAILSRHRRILNARLAALCAREGTAHLLRIPEGTVSPPDRHRTPETYRVWGDAIAGQMVTVLESTCVEARAEAAATVSERAAEKARLDALRRLGILDTPPEERFDRIVEYARSSFGADIAALSFIDEDRQWFKSRRGGREPGLMPRSGSFCDHAIRDSRPLIVDDATLHPVFRSSPYVTGDDGILFYAGHPISTPEGERVGTLCVMGSSPREFTEMESALLRDLALLLQKELWEWATDSSPATEPRG